MDNLSWSTSIAVLLRNVRLQFKNRLPEHSPRVVHGIRETRRRVSDDSTSYIQKSIAADDFNLRKIHPQSQFRNSELVKTSHVSHLTCSYKKKYFVQNYLCRVDGHWFFWVSWSPLSVKEMKLFLQSSVFSTRNALSKILVELNLISRRWREKSESFCDDVTRRMRDPDKFHRELFTPTNR